DPRIAGSDRGQARGGARPFATDEHCQSPPGADKSGHTRVQCVAGCQGQGRMTENRNSDRDEGGHSTPRQRAIEAYGNARDRVSNAGRRAGETIEEAPLIVLAAGLAAGAAIAALL